MNAPVIQCRALVPFPSPGAGGGITERLDVGRSAAEPMVQGSHGLVNNRTNLGIDKRRTVMSIPLRKTIVDELGR